MAKVWTASMISIDNTARKAEDLTPLLAGFDECSPDHGGGILFTGAYSIMHYCNAGKGYYTVEGQTLEVNKGDIFFVCPGEKICWIADHDDPWHYIWIGFVGKEAHRIFDLPRVLHYDQGSFFRIRDAVKNKILAPELYLSILYEIYYHLFRADSLPVDVCKWVDENIRINYADITVEAAAEMVGLDRSYLSSIYKKRYGISIKERIIRVRMERAAELLEIGYSVSESARLVGYSDAFTFSKMFRKVMGVSPSALKQKGLT